MSAGAILGGASIGAGVGVSSVALAPFNAANTFMGSAFFGYGMILGERYAYQEDWPKIQARLVNGEKIENIIQEYTGVFTAVVMKEAKIIFDTVTREFIQIMKEALLGIVPQSELDKIPDNAPTIGDPRRPPPSSSIPKPPTTQPPITPKDGVKLPPVQVPQTPTHFFQYIGQTGKTETVTNTKNQIIIWTASLISDMNKSLQNKDAVKWKSAWVNAVIKKFPQWWPEIQKLVTY